MEVRQHRVPNCGKRPETHLARRNCPTSRWLKAQPTRTARQREDTPRLTASMPLKAHPRRNHCDDVEAPPGRCRSRTVTDTPSKARRSTPNQDWHPPGTTAPPSLLRRVPAGISIPRPIPPALGSRCRLRPWTSHRPSSPNARCGDKLALRRHGDGWPSGRPRWD
jgi:hypothetical protein